MIAMATMERPAAVSDRSGLDRSAGTDAATPLLQITYTSLCRRTLWREDVKHIVRRSQARNDADRITGLLLADGHNYLQAIEGEPDAVLHCMRRIEQDPRHTEIRRIGARRIPRRQFGHWSMSCRTVAEDPGAFSMLVLDDIARLDDDHIRAMFIGFARLASLRP